MFLRAKEQKCDSLSKNKRIIHVTLCYVKNNLRLSLFCIERLEQFAHNRSLRRAILNERANERIPNLVINCTIRQCFHLLKYGFLRNVSPP